MPKRSSVLVSDVEAVEYLDVEDLVDVARLLLGDPLPMRDMGLLGSAAARPETTVFGTDAYPDLWTKAAALLQSIARNHALVDGNKRLGWLATAVFLEINGVAVIHASNDAVHDLVLGVEATASTRSPLLFGASWPTRAPGRVDSSEQRLCAPGRIRTCDTRFRKPMLYPLSYEGRLTKALVGGHEIVAGWSNGSHLIILGRGLAAAYGTGSLANAQVTGVATRGERRFGGPSTRRAHRASQSTLWRSTPAH